MVFAISCNHIHNTSFVTSLLLMNSQLYACIVKLFYATQTILQNYDLPPGFNLNKNEIEFKFLNKNVFIL